MASIQVTAFKGSRETAQGDPVWSETITIDATSAQITNKNTGDLNWTVRIQTDAQCYIRIGLNPTAVNTNPGDNTGSFRMASGSTEYLQLAPGQTVAGITA